MKKIILTAIFAVTTLFGATAQNTDKTIVITSDWHLSDSRSFASDCYYAWCDKNQSRILAHLNQLTKDKDLWDILVLNGDIFEFWHCPANVFTVADANGNVIDDVQYLGRIKEQNADIFATLEKLHAEGKEIIYMPGNHDLSVSADEIEAAFPKLFTCKFDTEGTGIYEPFGEGTPVVIEHGNRYEYFDAPYQHGVFGSEGTSSTSLISPGFFVSSLDATKDVLSAKASQSKGVYMPTLIDASSREDTDADNLKYLSSIWNVIRIAEDVPSYTVKTRIDGIGSAECDSCTWKDYATSETNNPRIYKDSWKVDNWKKRQELNKVPVYIPLTTSVLATEFHGYLDDMAYIQRLNNTSLPTLICVFGHSHVKMLTTRHDATKGDVIYLNEGAWIDKTSVCTYGVIRYTADKHQYAVELRQFDADATDKLIDCRYLYVPENNTTKLADGTLMFNSRSSLVTPEATGIDNVLSPESNIQLKAGYYNLNGQRLSTPAMGINIINGKKVIIHSSDFRIND